MVLDQINVKDHPYLKEGGIFWAGNTKAPWELLGKQLVGLLCIIGKAVLSVKKQLPEGRFGLTKYNNIGTFEQIVGPNRPSGNCQANCFLAERTAPL